MSEIRVLQIFGEPFSNGGQESYIMNMYRNIDRTKVQFDFFTPFQILNEKMKEEVEALGGHMYAAGHPFGEDNNRYFRESVTAFLPTHPYTIVHIHSGSTYALMIGSKTARRCGAKNVIVHSHCGGFVNLKYKVVRVISHYALMKYPTRYFACSHLAARWKYPAAVIRKQNYTVLKNAVDTTVFRYDPVLRAETRAELGLRDDQLAVGNIGRFTVQKNHDYLLDIFAALAKKDPDARLVLAGYGVKEQEIRDKIQRLGIQDRVLFLGLRRDAPALMNAFDVFVLPSFFEGLPMVGVEAQATGLPVVTSTGVTPELPLEDLAVYKPLADSPESWADQILESARIPRRDTATEMAQAGYDVKVAASVMQHYYEEMA